MDGVFNNVDAPLIKNTLVNLPSELPRSKACRTGAQATPKEGGLPNLAIAIGLASHHHSCEKIDG